MSVLAELTELLHLAHTRPQKLRLEPAFLLSAFTLEGTGHAEIAGRKTLTLRAKPRAERDFMEPLSFDFSVVADELTAAVDAELGLLLAPRGALFGRGGVTSRLKATKLEHPTDFGSELTRLEVPKGTAVTRDLINGCVGRARPECRPPAGSNPRPS